jgi:uncharacterized metal-binding protein YceD (DUF177 family)
MNDHDQPWSRRVALADVPDEGLHVAMEADADARATLARTAGLRDLPRLEANFDIRRKGSGLHIEGEIIAIVGQNCVVTLDPIEKTLHESVDLVFAPDASGLLGDQDGEASIGMTDAEPPESLVGGIVDLGAIATEYFLLGIDPYPRKEGAVFEEPAHQEPAESPFAALASLRKPPLGRK